MKKSVFNRNELYKPFSIFLLESGQSVETIKSSNSFIGLVQSWLFSVNTVFEEYANLLPLNLIQHTLSSLFKELDSARKIKSIADIIKEIDDDLDQLISYCYAQFVRYHTIHPSDILTRNFPLDKNIPGVKFTCHVIMKDRHVKTFGIGEDYLSATAADKGDTGIGTRYLKFIKKSVNSVVWLDSSLQALQLNHHRVIKHKSPHAEDEWFIKYSAELIQFCVNELSTPLSTRLIDKFPLTHFVSDVRIEFYSTTSCCEECWPYFRALRHHLNSIGLLLPILVFAYKPYQASDQYSSIFYISLTGEYIDPGLSWDHKPMNRLVCIKPSSFNLNNTYRQYLELEVHGRTLIPALVTQKMLVENFMGYLYDVIESRRTDPIFLNWAVSFSLTLHVALGILPANHIQALLVEAAHSGHYDMGIFDFEYSETYQNNVKSQLKTLTKPSDAIWFFGFLFSRSFAYADLDIIEGIDRDLGKKDDDTERKMSMSNNHFSSFSGLKRITMYFQLSNLSNGIQPNTKNRDSADKVWKYIAIRREKEMIENQINPENGDNELMSFCGGHENTQKIANFVNIVESERTQKNHDTMLDFEEVDTESLSLKISY